MNFDEWWKTNGIEMATYAEKSAARKGWDASKRIEREECAKICESRRRTVSNGSGLSMFSHDPASIEAGYCADDIRSKA